MKISSHSDSVNRIARGKKRAIPNNIRDRCLASFQKLRRIESSNFDGYCRCISCGKVMHWKESEGGHYIPRGCKATELEPDNVWAQCHECNGLKNGNEKAYRERLIRRIGIARVERLENMRDAYYGSEEAMQKLAMNDQISVIQNRTKKYYLDRKREIDEKLKNI